LRTALEHREDVSAVLTPDKHLWLGSDETSTIECLSLILSFCRHKQFRVADFIELPAPSDQEIDIEGLTYAGHYLGLLVPSWKRKKPNPIKLMKKIFRD